MRRKNCIISFGKTMCTLLLGIFVSGITSSCTDDLDNNKDYGKGSFIGFDVSLPQNGKKAHTRGGALSDGGNADITDIEVAPIKGATSSDGKQLYLHTVTFDGFTPDVKEELEKRERKLKGITGQTVAQDGSQMEAERPMNGVPGKASGTRAAPVTSMYSDATMFANIYPADAANWWTNNRNYFTDVRISAAEGWKTTEQWPYASAWKLNFYGYAPHHCPGVSVKNNDGFWAPKITYTVPDDVTKQTDLLTTSRATERIQSQGKVPLKFEHTLSAIRFETGDMQASRITKIALKGVYGKGEFNIGEFDWENQTNSRDFTQILDVTTSSTSGEAINPPSGTFMMIPQTLPTGAKIEVTLTDLKTGYGTTLTADIGGTKWSRGYTYTYKINTSSITEETYLDILGYSSGFSYKGGSGAIYTRSYLARKVGSDISKIPVRWKAEFSTDNGRTWHTGRPSWLREFPETGGGTLTSEERNTIEVRAQSSAIQVNSADQALRNRPFRKDWYYLPTKGGTVPETTANCYMVDAPGYYYFPLVYGNAIRRGYIKEAAYTMTIGDMSNCLEKFVNHRGARITDPYIYNNAGCNPSEADLVWQDAKDLLRDVKLSDDKKLILFYVATNTIQEGNAVVAVRDASGDIMWSWHIWVTNYNPSQDVAIKQHFRSGDNMFMSKYLGWCDSKSEYFFERSIKFRIVQELPAKKNPRTEYGAISQGSYFHEVGVNNVYYQYGRKDPIVGIGKGNVAKTWYDGGGNEYVGVFFRKSRPNAFGEGIQCIKNCILNPAGYCVDENMDNKYVNLWNNNGSVDGFASRTDRTIKTIYDPCPPGYAVPHYNAFRQFTTTRENTDYSSEFNVSGSFQDGFNFYTGYGGTFFLPATGDASWDGKYYGQLGCTWLSGCNTEQGYELHFMRNHVKPIFWYSKGLAKPILPVREN